ncbi:unnamed protein product [Linum trigynum]|uniref:Uncharacterized protein n=1 Tax=Linum trigynum TaxID=586398 RepID=A0AAV2GBG0_9ROSI
MVAVITTEGMENRGCARRVFGTGFRFVVTMRKVRIGDPAIQGKHIRCLERAPRRRNCGSHADIVKGMEVGEGGSEGQTVVGCCFDELLPQSKLVTVAKAMEYRRRGERAEVVPAADS